MHPPSPAIPVRATVSTVSHWPVMATRSGAGTPRRAWFWWNVRASATALHERPGVAAAGRVGREAAGGQEPAPPRDQRLPLGGGGQPGGRGGGGRPGGRGRGG